MDKCILWSVMVLFPSSKAVIELEVCYVSWTRGKRIRCFSEGDPGIPLWSGALPEVVSAQRWAWMSLHIHMSKETCPSDVSQNSEKSHTSQWSTFLSFRGDILLSFLSKKCSEAPRARLRALNQEVFNDKKNLLQLKLFVSWAVLFHTLAPSTLRGEGYGPAPGRQVCWLLQPC